MLVITAPHAYCPVTIPRVCDLLSGQAAELLANDLADLQPHLLINTNVLRSVSDLNRPTSAEQPYHQQLRSLLSHGQGGLLIDVHSYPGLAFEDQVYQPLYANSEQPHEVYLLLKLSSSSAIKRATARLANLLAAAEVEVAIYSADEHQNYILNIGLEHGLTTVLIEFNEALSNQRLEYIVQHVAAWAREILA